MRSGIRLPPVLYAVTVAYMFVVALATSSRYPPHEVRLRASKPGTRAMLVEAAPATAAPSEWSVRLDGRYCITLPCAHGMLAPLLRGTCVDDALSTSAVAEIFFLVLDAPSIFGCVAARLACSRNARLYRFRCARPMPAPGMCLYGRSLGSPCHAERRCSRQT